MRKTLNRIAAGVTAVATMGSMFLTVAPVHAAPLTDTKDTLSREQISITSVGHSLVTTLPSISTGNKIIFDYATSGFSSLAAAAGGTCASGTCTFTVTATNAQITCTSGPCSGLLTAGTFTATNPSSAGSKSITYTSYGPETVSGTFAIPIVDSDQVTVTATVAPSITFDIDTHVSTDALNTTETAAPYSVALGTITTSDSRASGTTDTVNYIMMDLDTNATGGAVITVKNANGANGLASTSVPADDIDSVTGTIANGTENYGICVTATSATTGSFTEVAPFDNADCAGDDQTPTVGGFDGTSQSLVNTGSGAISVGRVMVTVAAGISTLTDAHNDYTDTLTFIATGTF